MSNASHTFTSSVSAGGPLPFRLTLFSTDAALIRDAIAAGIDEIIVDWEHIGKAARQSDADTQINYDTVEDLRRVRTAVDGARGSGRVTVIYRVNASGPTTDREIEQAIDAGADEILVPMVRTPQEAVSALRRADGRCGVGVLIETVEAVHAAASFAALPLTRVYIGLNDLAIARRSPHIFAPLLDGTLEALRDVFAPGVLPFGFGGLTLPDRGTLIPCRLLIGEMARLRCAFSFLRRSFHRDMQGRVLTAEVPRLRAAIGAAWERDAQAVAADRAALIDALERLGAPGLKRSQA